MRDNRVAACAIGLFAICVAAFTIGLVAIFAIGLLANFAPSFAAGEFAICAAIGFIPFIWTPLSTVHPIQIPVSLFLP